VPAWSLPLTRGCTPAGHDRRLRQSVSPAHARMRPNRTPTLAPVQCLSRARADAPFDDTFNTGANTSLPRTRGCTPAELERAFRIVVSRARADAPFKKEGGDPKALSLPRTRGCTLHADSNRHWRFVFPAHARTHPPASLPFNPKLGLSRTRADAPVTAISINGATASLPRTRGCTRVGRAGCGGQRVSPAHARLHPRWICGSRSANGLSRARAMHHRSRQTGIERLGLSRVRADPPAWGHR